MKLTRIIRAHDMGSMTEYVEHPIGSRYFVALDALADAGDDITPNEAADLDAALRDLKASYGRYTVDGPRAYDAMHRICAVLEHIAVRASDGEADFDDLPRIPGP